MALEFSLSIALAATLFAFAGEATAAGQDVIWATPEGVTLQVVKNRGGAVRPSKFFDVNAAKDTDWVFATAAGKTSYTYAKDTEAGKSACVDECAKAWPPLLALPKAKAFGDWSLVAREGGIKQWAYRGKPLYASAKDEKIGEAKGIGGDWRIAPFEPAVGMTLPRGFGVQSVSFAHGQVLTDDRNLTLYVYDGDVRKDGRECVVSTCAKGWLPVLASEMAKPMGDFTVLTRADETRQWAYKGKGLYSFTGDIQLGTSNGVGMHLKWKPAYVARYYLPPNVDMLYTSQRGEILATTEGLTLYKREFHYGYNNGRGRPGSTPGNPAMGRVMGTQGCDATCLKDWHPLTAPTNAQPWGYWEILTRDDGTRQWSYKGYALYTYSGDTKAGDLNGNFIYQVELSEGRAEKEGPRLEQLATNALYWTHMEP